MMQTTGTYTLRHLAAYFLKLGTTGFGGPVALVEYMHRDLVEQRRWITEEDYKEGLALAQLMPGPLAAQLCMYIGYVHHRVLGATLAGIAFVLPSFLMVLAIGVAYVRFGGLPWMQAVFYGVGAAVIAIIALSSIKLMQKSVGRTVLSSMRERWLLWLLFAIACAITIVLEREEVWLFIAAGVAYMLVKAPPRWARRPGAASIVLAGLGFLQFEWNTLGRIALFFGEAGAFVFGSGLAIIPFLHEAVTTQGWLNEQQFLDAVAVAMITPGPVVITVGFIGYLVAGFPGACVAALATFLPCYLLTVIPAPYVKRLTANASVKAFVDGITASVVGALMGAVVVIALRSIGDPVQLIIALASVVVLLAAKRMKEPWLIALAALAGLMLFNR